MKRFNAVRGYHAQQGREIVRCLKELRLLRKEALARTDEPGEARKNEPERTSRNEPKGLPPANDDSARPPDPRSQNEPNDAAPARVAALRVAIMEEHAACRAEPGRDPEIMAGLVRELGDAWGSAMAAAG